MKAKAHLLSLAIQGSFLATLFFKSPQTLPVSEFIIERDAYTLSYDGSHRQARWVYEVLTEEKIQNKKAVRTPFQEDPEVPEILRARLDDYSGTGFDRGHLCPAADAVSSVKKMKETSYLSNISPQLPQFNRGYWKKLENHVRGLTKSYKALHVYTGPLYLPVDGYRGERYVKYQVIGENDVAVPTHYFKLILAEKKNGGVDRIAYILPNETIETKTPLEEFEVTIEKLERASGIIFNAS